LHDDLKTVPGTVFIRIVFLRTLLVLRGEDSARDWTCEDADGLTLQFGLENAANGGAIDLAGRSR
jgi:hypothetical protein